jgi:hypothetical protein
MIMTITIIMTKVSNVGLGSPRVVGFPIGELRTNALSSSSLFGFLDARDSTHEWLINE